MLVVNYCNEHVDFLKFKIINKQQNNRLHICLTYCMLAGWLGGVVVRALDSRCAGHVFDSHAAAALPGNNLGQVVHTNVPLFTKQ